MATIREICQDALEEIGALASGEAIDATNADFCRRKLQRIYNLWNAERRAVYATLFSTFTLTPNLSPHTIGPTGATFTTTQRPVDIDHINLILQSSPQTIYVGMTKRDVQWWDAQTTPALATQYPTDFYYNPDWPNGSIYFWPVPTAAFDVDLTTRVLINDTLTLNDTFSLPPGYQEAITLTLAEQLARPFGKMPPPTLAGDAAHARGVVFVNNDQVPRLRTADDGMQGPSTAGVRSSFKYLTGQGG